MSKPKHKIPDGRCVETTYGFAFNGVIEVERVASSIERGRPWAAITVRFADGSRVDIQASKRKHWVTERDD